MASEAQNEGGEAGEKAKREVIILCIAGVMGSWRGVTSAHPAVGATVLCTCVIWFLYVVKDLRGCTFRLCRPNLPV